MLGFVALAIVVAAATALMLATRLQRRRLRRRFRLEIANQGNVRSRYHLRAEGGTPGELLDCRFMLGADLLGRNDLASAPAAEPEKEAGLVARAGDAGRQVNQKLDRTVGSGGALADSLAALGSMLPYSVGAPLLRRAATLQRGRMQIRQVQRVPGQVARLRGLLPIPGPRTPAAAGSKAAARPAAEQAWAETPYVRPGETLAVDLLVRAAPQSRGQACSFRLLTRSAEQPDAPLVVEEGRVQVGGGFWSHRYLSFAVILAVAAALLLLAAWLSAQGMLAW